MINNIVEETKVRTTSEYSRLTGEEMEGSESFLVDRIDKCTIFINYLICQICQAMISS